MKFQKKYAYCILLILFMVSCEVEVRQNNPNPPPPQTCSSSINGTVTINYATDCNTSDACTFTFPCTTAVSFAQTPISSLRAVFKNLTHKLHLEQDLKATTQAQFTISSIITQDTPTLLQISVGVVNGTSFLANSPLECTIDDVALTVTCVNFAPLADHFTMAGTLGDTSVNLDVTINTSGITPTTKNADGSSSTGGMAECGQFGIGSTPDATHYTTEQRMYDCSKRIGNFAGSGNGNGTFTNFVPGDSDSITASWFTVTCPLAGVANPQKCSLLSPVIQLSRATGANEFTSTINGTQGVAMSTLENNRILWSGLLTIAPHMSGSTSYPQDTANFFEANGNNPWATSPAQYDYYKYNEDVTVIRTFTSGPIGPICAPGGSCDWGQDQINSVYSTNGYYPAKFPATSDDSICQQLYQTNEAMIPVASYEWQMPSYPMLMTLTGGNSAYCESGGFGYDNSQRAFCLSVSADAPQYLGLRAIDPIPNFLNNFLWSSSVNDSFSSLSFNSDGNGRVRTNDLTKGYGVRCSSLAW